MAVSFMEHIQSQDPDDIDATSIESLAVYGPDMVLTVFRPTEVSQKLAEDPGLAGRLAVILSERQEISDAA
ncbi:MAG TPA: hypothetical protein VLE69_01735 [Candidatus Saccharimonadales bacterium]|nr:hypothetical protein [Candidatus Saccharimonadales bacterium]